MPFDGIVTKAVTEELEQTIVQGKINKIYQPTKTELVFTIRNRGENHTLLLSIHPVYARVHLTNESYRNPETPPMFCMLLRKHLTGAIIESIKQHNMERIITFTMRTRNEIGDITYKTIIAEIMGKHSNVMLVDAGKQHILDSLKHVSAAQNRHRTILPGQPYVLPPAQNKLNPLEIDGETCLKRLDFNAGKLHMQIVHTLVGFSPFFAQDVVKRAELGSPQVYAETLDHVFKQIRSRAYEPAIYRNSREDFHVLPLTKWSGTKETFSSISKMLDAFYSGKAERDRVKQQAKDLYRWIKNEKQKNERKLKKHNATLNKAQEATEYRKLGELLTAHMHLVEQGDSSVSVTDYYDPQQKTLQIELDPLKTPSENAQHYYKRYRKLQMSQQMMEKEISKTKEEIAYLDQLLQQIDVATSDDLEEIREELQEEGYLKKQTKRKKSKRQHKKPLPDRYQASDGTFILVGKNNKQNEYVTRKLADRDDIWLHTKNIPGSHVVIRSSNPSEETLHEAAQLAAFFSKSRQSSSVPVDYTKVRYVKKPTGAKPGFVTYEHQKTLFVTPDESIVASLKNNVRND